MRRACIGLLVAGWSLASACGSIPERDVRYQPTPESVVREMLQLACVRPEDVVFDLGSGDGRIPIMAAKEIGARGVGVEIDPALVARAKANARAAGVDGKVEFRLGNMYAADLRGATVVTLFLHPQPNLKLRPKLRAELPSGARVVSYVWNMGDWLPDETRRVNRHSIFRWTIRHPAAPPRRSASPSTYSQPQGGSMILKSSAFTQNGDIPRVHTCEGDDVSPPLAWHGEPAGTKTFALIVDDPDAPDPKAPKMTWVHWVVYNLPASAHALDTGASRRLPPGARDGKNDWKRTGYGGPCPPIGRHRYFHKLYALDVELPNLHEPTKPQLEAAMKGHVLAQAELVGTYQKGR